MNDYVSSSVEEWFMSKNKNKKSMSFAGRQKCCRASISGQESD